MKNQAVNYGLIFQYSSLTDIIRNAICVQLLLDRSG